MRIKSKYKPELVASDDANRVSLVEPWLDVEERKMVAANGAALLAVSVEINDTDTPGIVPKIALKQARRLDGRKAQTNDISLNGKALLSDGSEYSRETTGEMPDWCSALPMLRRGDKGTFSIAFDAQLLATLAKAMGTEQVILTFDVKDSRAPISVESNEPGPKETIAVLMPCRQV